MTQSLRRKLHWQCDVKHGEHTVIVVVARSAPLSSDKTSASKLAASVALGRSVLAALQEARCAGADGGAVGCVASLGVLLPELLV